MSHVLFDNMNLECLTRLLLACVCGGIIGIERMRRNKGAGIRTHIIVAVGAALFVIVSKYGFIDIVSLDHTKVDVSRVASSIVSGISFLGAGIIFMRGDSIQGLTTAAGVWVTAAIGASLGAGMYLVGIIGTVMMIAMQFILHHGLALEMENMAISRIVVNMKDDPAAFDALWKQLESRNIQISRSHIKRHKDTTFTYTLDVRLPRELTTDDLLTLVKECSDVKSIGI
jgi:putative Mg2+ transporter-C (MgtC) family protein